MTSKIEFPVGYYHFHELANVNFQLNRLVLNGAKKSDVERIAKKIHDFHDWKREMSELASKAVIENDLVQASSYYRAAEFFTNSADPDKEIFYDKYIEYFYKANPEAVELKTEIPYENSFLPAIVFPHKNKKDTIVVHGGFDSFGEEYYKLGLFYQNAGYEVIIFEGPGQGASIIKNHIVMTHEWEKPVKAVLDHFKLKDVILLGISLGGYLAIRAAAFESRITRVIAFNVFYDFFQIILHTAGPRIRKIMTFLLKLGITGVINRVLKKMMQSNLVVNWGIDHGMHVLDAKTPVEYIAKVRLYSAEKISHLVTQHVLLTAGKNDHFVPIEMFYKQIESLTNVKSLTCRLFTGDQYDSDHCQLGNRKLAYETILSWIENLPGKTLIEDD